MRTYMALHSYFDADPDLAFDFDADPAFPKLMRIRICNSVANNEWIDEYG